METVKKGLSGSALKMIAIVTMLIDHTAAVILARLILSGRYGGVGSAAAASGSLYPPELLYTVYQIMRNIGRIAFPIFCFLLVEGFLYTRNKGKYALRLFLFALISEVPFDLALSGTAVAGGYQNIFFTLLLGLLTMMVDQAVWERIRNDVLRFLAQFAVIFAGMGAAELLHTDYGAKGVMCILILYMFRGNRRWQAAAGALAFVWWEPWALLAFIPITLYNGKRGWSLKYFFYAFYPLHLLLLYLICWQMGTAQISAV